jgi:endonuclease YncB( thermonuclease family)
MHNTLKAGLAALVMLLGVDTAAAATVRVVDGDTIELSGITYRLHGIDAPEAGQKCAKANGGKWDCGKAALGALEALAFSGTVSCDTRGTDGFSRVIGVCTVDGKDMNAAMVKAGLAWAFRKYSTDYVAQEEKAKADRVGIWQADTQTAEAYTRALAGYSGSNVREFSAGAAPLSGFSSRVHLQGRPLIAHIRMMIRRLARHCCVLKTLESDSKT